MNTKRNKDTLAQLWVLSVIGIVLAAFAIANAQTTDLVSTQMGPGDSSAQVSALQSFLAADPSVYPQGLVTGYYGSLTVAAVQAYQCKNGIVCSGDPTSTGYGVVGPTTLAKIEMQQGTNSGGGVSLPPVASQPTGGVDLSAPVISAPTVATSSSSATISWNTSEPATSRVMYGTAWPFLYATAQSAQSVAGLSQNASATISGLSPNTTYYYVLESVDASGNLQWSIDHSFTTGA